VLPREPVRAAFRSLSNPDPVLHGQALEFLEGALPPGLRDKLWPMIGASPA
jgi:hypothetical protein